MYNGSGYSWNNYGNELCSLEKSIGDAKAEIAKEVGDAECSILKEVGSTSSAIIDRMGTYASADIKNASDIALAQSTALNSVERDLQNRIHETRQILLKEVGDKASRTDDFILSSAQRVADKSDAQYADIKNQLRYFETSVAKQFCQLETEGLKNTSRVLETISANKYDALKDEVDAIRADRHSDKYSYNFALQNQELAYLKQMINSVENNQKFGSKTVQFGAGNQAGTAQTANQG